jgi:uncharacterized membrane protein YhhN
MSTIAETRRGPFSDYFSVTLLMGCVAGMLFAFSEDWLGLLAAPLLLTVPGIVWRSPVRILRGLLLGCAGSFAIVMIVAGFLSIDGGGTMPIVGYYVPGLVMVMDGGSNWVGHIYAALFCYLIGIDFLMLVMRGPWDVGRAIVAIAASSLAAAILFPLSWFVTPRDYVVLPLHKWQFLQAAELTIFGLIWPVNYLLLNYLYAPELFRRPRGEAAPEPPVDTRPARD